MATFELETPDGAVYSVETAGDEPPSQDQINEILSGGSSSSESLPTEGAAKKPSERNFYQDLLSAIDIGTANAPGEGTISKVADYSLKNLAGPVVNTLLSHAQPGMGPLGPMVGNVAESMIDKIPETTYGDAARGAGQGVGQMVGSGAGPVGSLVGGTTGQILADRGVHGIDNMLMGTDTPYSWDQFTGATREGLMSSVIGEALPAGKPGALPPSLKPMYEKQNYDAAIDTLTKALGPTVKEAAPSLRMDGLPAEPSSMRSAVQELIENYGADFGSPEKLQSYAMNKLGYAAKDGSIIDGSLHRDIARAADFLDKAAPPIRFSDPIPFQGPTGTSNISLPEYLKQSLKTHIEKNFGDGTVESEVARDEGMARIRELGEQLVPETTRSAIRKTAEDLGFVRKQIAIKERELDITSNPTTQAKLQSEISDLVNAESNYENELAQLEVDVDNANLSFNDIWQKRIEWDNLAKDAHNNPEKSKTIPEVYKNLSNALRDFENQRAKLIDPNGALVMDKAQREYSLLNDIMDGVSRNAAKGFRDDKAPGFFSKLKAYVTVGMGRPRVNFTEDAFKMLGAKDMRASMSHAQSVIDSSGAGWQPEWKNAYDMAKSSMAKSAQATVRGIVATTASRSANDYQGNASSLKTLENSMTMQALYDAGLVTPEEKQNGVDLNQVELRNPGLFAQAMTEVSRVMATMRDAIEFGDDDDAGVAVMQASKLFPSIFPKPKTGIKGEVVVNGKIKLYDPMDRAKYSETIRRDQSKSTEDQARIVSELNDTWTVVP